MLKGLCLLSKGEYFKFSAMCDVDFNRLKSDSVLFQK